LGKERKKKKKTEENRGGGYRSKGIVGRGRTPPLKGLKQGHGALRNENTRGGLGTLRMGGRSTLHVFGQLKKGTCGLEASEGVKKHRWGWKGEIRKKNCMPTV